MSTVIDRAQHAGAAASGKVDIDSGAGWLLRLKPDEDLVGALTEFAAERGLARLRVIGGVGSLMRASLRDADGRDEVVEGPGVEIVTVSGVLFMNSGPVPASSPTVRAEPGEAAGAPQALPSPSSGRSEIQAQGEREELSVVVADLQGQIHAGRPLAGGNPICVTIELFLQGC